MSQPNPLRPPGCSTISFRSRPLPEALETISRAGFGEVDLGAIPGVCDHVPIPLPKERAAAVRRDVLASGLRVRAINADPGDFNGPAGDPHSRRQTIDALCQLATGVGATVVVLPCGRSNHEPDVSLEDDLRLVAAGLEEASGQAGSAGLRLLFEAPHVQRLCYDVGRARLLVDLVPPEVAGLVFDVSHVLAGGGDPVAFAREFGGRIEHVHLRDARPGNINLSVGRGEVDFAGTLGALAEEGYDGTLSFELETHDVGEGEREREAVAARGYVLELMGKGNER